MLNKETPILFNQSVFDERFNASLTYAKRIVRKFFIHHDLQNELIQEYCTEVLSRKHKYYNLLKGKRTVYNIPLSKSAAIRNKSKDSFKDEYNENASFDEYSNVTGPEPHEYASVSLNEKCTDHLESILYSIFPPNGRKGCVHSFEKQNWLIQQYQQSELTVKEFCKKHKVSSATIFSLLKYGPKRVKPSLTLQIVKLHLIEEYRNIEIAQKLNISKHSVAQQLYKAKKKLRNYYEIKSNKYHQSI